MQPHATGETFLDFEFVFALFVFTKIERNGNRSDELGKTSCDVDFSGISTSRRGELLSTQDVR